LFAANTYEQFLSKLTELEKNGIDSLVIDVRGDSGGYLTTVDSILKKFMTKKQVVYQLKKGSNVSKTYGEAKKNKKYKIILLGDENSASASELLIVRIRENYDNSIFVGKKTYGKGTAQEMVSLDSDNKYKITTKKWLTPKGNWINDTEGIIPDIEIDTEEISFGDTNYNDAQLNKALEEATK
jgi:carboxyl-terminal processing protease